ALDLGDDRGVRTEGRLARDAAGEAGADDALDHEWLPDRQAAARVLERDAPRDAGAGGRAVDLAVREHADVARISAGAERRAGEDRAVQEGQLRLERVRDLARGHDGFLDAPARVDQPAVVRGGHREPDLRDVDVRVEGTAERDVVPDPADARYLDGLVESEDQRRDVLERDARHAVAIAPRASGDAPRGRVDANDVARREHARFEGDGGERDDPVAAHRAPALVVHEQHAEISVRRDGIGDDRAVHVGMPARLEHEPAAEPVEVLAGPFPFRDDRVARDRIDPLEYDPQRLTGGVRVDHADAAPVTRRLPGEALRVLERHHWEPIAPGFPRHDAPSSRRSPARSSRGACRAKTEAPVPPGLRSRR